MLWGARSHTVVSYITGFLDKHGKNWNWGWHHNGTCRWYRAWDKFILLWAIYSSFFTPMEFGFFNGLPENLFVLDIVGQVAFLLDIVLQFFVGYRDKQTYRMVYQRPAIAFRCFIVWLLPMYFFSFLLSWNSSFYSISKQMVQSLSICLLSFSFLKCRYLKSTFVIDLLACLPWDLIYKVFLR